MEWLNFRVILIIRTGAKGLSTSEQTILQIWWESGHVTVFDVICLLLQILLLKYVTLESCGPVSLDPHALWTLLADVTMGCGTSISTEPLAQRKKTGNFIVSKLTTWMLILAA